MSEGKVTVLVIDDEVGVRASLVDYLDLSGLSVFSANDAAEAYQVLEKEKIECAIVDMRLPDVRGDELILRAHEISPETNYLIHTGSLDFVLPKPLQDMGLTNDNILQKPILDMKIV